jgi:hypothetical protein
MARQSRNMEGDNPQRRRNARAARAEGKSPSEESATLGASKQREETSRNASHQERIQTPNEGKRGAGTSGKPRPGNRDADPKRTGHWR